MKYPKRVSLLDETRPALQESDRAGPEGGVALTVTLNPKMYVFKPFEQYRRTSQFILKLAKRYKLTFLYLVPELTEIGGNIHYHGTFKCPDDNLRKLFLRSLGKTVGFIMTKFITDEPYWNRYCHKDRLYNSLPQYEILQFGQGAVPLYREENRRAAVYDFFNIDVTEDTF